MTFSSPWSLLELPNSRSQLTLWPVLFWEEVVTGGQVSTVEKTRAAQFDLWTNLSAHTCANLNITSITSSDYLAAASSKMKFVCTFANATIYFIRGNLLEPSISPFGSVRFAIRQSAHFQPTLLTDNFNITWIGTTQTFYKWEFCSTERLLILLYFY